MKRPEHRRQPFEHWTAERIAMSEQPNQEPFMYREDLTPRDIAMLDQNWHEANAFLDHLLAMQREHDQTHCTDWYCGTEEMSRVMDSLDTGAALMVLRAATARLV